MCDIFLREYFRTHTLESRAFYWVNGLAGRPQKSRNKDRSFKRRSALGSRDGRGRDGREVAEKRRRRVARARPHGNSRTEHKQQQTDRQKDRETETETGRGRAGLLPPSAPTPKVRRRSTSRPTDGRATEFSDLWKKIR